MHRKSFAWSSLFVAAVLLASMACNMGGEADTAVPPTDTPTAKSVAPPTKPPAPADTPVPVVEGDPLLVSSLEDVKLATVQIEAQGTFVDPQVGLQLNVAGSGSGFIVHPSGIAVTNNHVVTGAALLRVWIGGETEPRNARVLGVSECSDLAVIDIEGDGYPYLEWYAEPVRVGLDVYAAGFPLGDPEFTLTRGIISKEKADGETDWASVGAVVEHDATINPGNSGGPLVTADGQVVAVNYASSPGYNQYFAIARSEAMETLERLQAEEDVASIGVNGSAVDDGYGNTGIWVASVASGSPADQAGVQGGDILTMIESIPLATDGTMADYCDILRSHGPQDTLNIQILRYATEEVLEGQLNGRELALAFSFANELEQEFAGETDGTGYSDHVSVSDDTRAISMDVPAQWNEIDGGVWTDDEGSVLGAAIIATSDLDAFNATYAEPGVIFLASASLAEAGDAAGLLDLFNFSEDCNYEGRYEYEDPLYSGLYELYDGCGETQVILLVVVALPADQSYATLLAVQAVTDSDLDAVDRILDTFVVSGELPDSGGYVPPPSDGNASLTVTNLTGESIWYVYISSTTADSWGEDWLGGDVIMSEDSFTFYLDAGYYDIAVADPDKEIVAERYDVEISGDQEWTVYTEGGFAELLLTNNSGLDVCYVRISSTTSDNWGDDWLGEDDVIVDGGSYAFFVPVDQQYYDLQALDCDGKVIAEEYDVDLRGDTEWTLGGAEAPPGGYSALAFDVTWETWAEGGTGMWVIKFDIDATGGDGDYSYQATDNYSNLDVFEIRWGCQAAFTGDIIVRSGDGQESKITQYIPAPSSGCD